MLGKCLFCEILLLIVDVPSNDHEVCTFSDNSHAGKMVLCVSGSVISTNGIRGDAGYLSMRKRF